MPFDLLAIYGAGVLTFVTPCVLPLIPIYLAALVGGSAGLSGARGRLVLRAGLFALGFVLVFTVLGLTASSLGGALSAHRSLVQVMGAVLILVFGLKFLGVLRIGLLDRVARLDERRLKTRSGAGNAVLMGVVFAAGWSPCVGPVLGSVLTYTAAATTGPAAGAGYLAVYGLGLATPLVVTAAFAEAGGRLLKRLRPLVPRLERVMGVALVGMALYTGVSAGLTMVREARADAGAVAALTAGPGGARQPVLVELYGKKCTACKAMQPIIDGMTRQCAERSVLVRQVDVETPLGRALVAQHHVLGVPTFLVLDRDGQLVTKLVGVQREAVLKDAVSGLATAPCPAATAAPVAPIPSCATAPAPAAPDATDAAPATCAPL